MFIGFSEARAAAISRQRMVPEQYRAHTSGRLINSKAVFKRHYVVLDA
jgi:hypothetical protein